MIISDIDHTISKAMPRYRKALMADGSVNWDLFYSLIPEDFPVPGAKMLLLYLIKFFRTSVLYFSSRPEEYLNDTIEWLKKWGFPFPENVMLVGRYDDSVEKKKEALRGISKEKRIILALDDKVVPGYWEKLEEVYRALFIPVLWIDDPEAGWDLNKIKSYLDKHKEYKI